MDSTYLPAKTILQERYEVGEEIGRGGFSVVYEALDHQTGEQVAVKLLVPPPAVAKLAKQRLQREVQATRALVHPVVVPVLAFVEDGPWTCLILRRISGKDLHTLVAERGPLPHTQVVQIGKDLADALQMAHKQGILHRDVKPQNTLIGVDGRTYLTDFGSARIEGQPSLTHTGALVGTLDYIPPEVLARQRGDARSDIYSLGLTLYFALTGKLPARPLAASAHMDHDGFHPAEASQDVPPWLDSVIAKATHDQPGFRFPTAMSLLHALEQTTSRFETSITALPESSCAVCGSPDPLRMTLCLSCQTPLDQKEKWIFVSRPGKAPQFHSIVYSLGRLLNLPTTSLKLKEVVQGRRPLAKVKETIASNCIKALAHQGVPILLQENVHAWSAIPFTFYLFVLLVLAAGVSAGVIAHSIFLWITPLLVVLMIVLAYSTMNRPLLKPQDKRNKLPMELLKRVVATISSLPQGTSKNLFADVVRMSQHFFSAGSEMEITVPVRQLVEYACDASMELHRLDETLTRLENQQALIIQMPEEWIQAHSRCEKARDSLVQRLLESVAVLGIAQSEITLAPQGISRRLAESTSQIREEIQIQAQVAREMEDLLGSA